MGKVCVAIIGSTANEMVDRATEVPQDMDFVVYDDEIKWPGKSPKRMSPIQIM